MKTSKILALLLVGCIGFAGCDGQKSPPDTTSFSQSLSESSGIGTENFDTLLASIDAHDLVVESIDGS